MKAEFLHLDILVDMFTKWPEGIVDLGITKKSNFGTIFHSIDKVDVCKRGCCSPTVKAIIQIFYEAIRHDKNPDRLLNFLQ